MFLMQYPGRDFPDPSTSNLPHPYTIKVAAEAYSHAAASNVICITQTIMDFIYLFPKSLAGSIRFFIWSWVKSVVKFV
jgi:hypothetical protein